MASAAQFSIGFVRDVVHFAAARGVDPDLLCARAGIAKTQLSRPDEMTDGTTVESVWQTAIALTGDYDLGLHLGEAAHPAALGLLGFAMLSCETLGQAIEKMARYWNLMSNATVIYVRRGTGTVQLELSILDLPGNFLQHCRYPVEASLSAAMSIARGLCGRPLPLLDVASTFPTPPNPREHERVFGRKPRFDAESIHLTFLPEALAWPVLHANPAMLEGFEEQMRQRMQSTAGTTGERVRQEVAKRLRGEAPELGVIARALSRSERVVQRELQMEGTTYRQVVDHLRKDLALGYLAAMQHSIADVSFLLGFSEPSVFHRSFRRWTGVTPQAYRKTAGSITAS